jgi:hypothetical protein
MVRLGTVLAAGWHANGLCGDLEQPGHGTHGVNQKENVGADGLLPPEQAVHFLSNCF